MQNENNKGMRRVTIRDVAEAAGVSVSTVSHVLNDYGDIGPETEQLVRKTMERLNYYPNASARRLTRNRSHLLHLLLFAKEGLHHPFFYKVICGIAEEAEKLDYELVLSVQRVEDGQERWRDSLRRCVESRGEGIIVMGSLPAPEVFEKLQSIQIPAVLVDIPHEGTNSVYVSSDNVTGAKLAVEHLLNLGHKKIAFIGGGTKEELFEQKEADLWKGNISQSRFRGYVEALGSRNIIVDTTLTGGGGFTQKGAQRAILEIISQHPDLSAVFAVSDLMAIGVIEAMRSIGKEIPRDIAVVGYDDIEAASFVRPQLTTVRQDGSEMGRRAVKEMMGLLTNPNTAPSKVLFPVELVVRESCGARLARII